MDAAEFQDWLSGVARLSQVLAFQALALFESAKTCDDGAAGFSGEAFAGTAAMPDAPVLPSSKQVLPDDLAGLAHRRSREECQPRVPYQRASGPSAGRTLQGKESALCPYLDRLRFWRPARVRAAFRNRWKGAIECLRRLQGDGGGLGVIGRRRCPDPACGIAFWRGGRERKGGQLRRDNDPGRPGAGGIKGRIRPNHVANGKRGRGRRLAYLAAEAGAFRCVARRKFGSGKLVRVRVPDYRACAGCCRRHRGAVGRLPH